MASSRDRHRGEKHSFEQARLMQALGFPRSRTRSGKCRERDSAAKGEAEKREALLRAAERRDCLRSGRQHAQGSRPAARASGEWFW